MIDLFGFKMPVFKKRARFITKNNDRKNTLPDHFKGVNGVKDKINIVWRREILIKKVALVETENRKKDSCNQKA